MKLKKGLGVFPTAKKYEGVLVSIAEVATGEGSKVVVTYKKTGLSATLGDLSECSKNLAETFHIAQASSIINNADTIIKAANPNNRFGALDAMNIAINAYGDIPLIGSLYSGYGTAIDDLKKKLAAIGEQSFNHEWETLIMSHAESLTAGPVGAAMYQQLVYGEEGIPKLRKDLGL